MSNTWTKICNNCHKRVKYTATCECKQSINRQNNRQKDINNPEEKKFFNSTKWKKLRLSIIERDGAHCQRCLIKYNIITTTSLEAHHIKSRVNYPELRWEATNLITLCKQCNTEIGTKDVLDFSFSFDEDEYYFTL